ncbi:folylpolyglutamate synthase/dihydrofolate synthase family protein, partial [Kosmotoga sp. DU53]|uniref:bifunctional folylpolyglutamate synthase/dihydrofolate synthase n=1 Tax=Kosmotoga sp. DU53 TaxID=1310160 RepID=UPI000AD864AC
QCCSCCGYKWQRFYRCFISSILKEAGYRVGTYISPHLIDFTERMTINGLQIKEEVVVEILNKIRPHITEVANSKFGSPTFFEVVTAMAFVYFKQQKVDFAVLEVGLGGENDATNVVKPLVSVITNSDYDHMDILGNDITSIAKEDAGIIKENGFVVTAAEGEALDVIKKIGEEKRARIYQIGRDIKYEFVNSDLKWQRFNVKGIFSESDNLKIPLLGKYQLINASCAVGAIEILRFYDIEISDESIRKGLENTFWPGRFEIVQDAPMVVLDGAHNHLAAKRLKEALMEVLEKKDKLILVIGIMKDKEVEKIVKELAPLAYKVVATSPKTPRATTSHDLREIVVKFNKNISVVEDVETALELALSEAKENDIVCVTGSLYTVGEARKFLL